MSIGANFWPGLPFGLVQVIACEDGEKITGPDGKVMTVRKGRAIQRGSQVFMEQADYEAIKYKIGEPSHD